MFNVLKSVLEIPRTELILINVLASVTGIPATGLVTTAQGTAGRFSASVDIKTLLGKTNTPDSIEGEPNDQ